MSARARSPKSDGFCRHLRKPVSPSMYRVLSNRSQQGFFDITHSKLTSWSQLPRCQSCGLHRVQGSGGPGWSMIHETNRACEANCASEDLRTNERQTHWRGGAHSQLRAPRRRGRVPVVVPRFSSSQSNRSPSRSQTSERVHSPPASSSDAVGPTRSPTRLRESQATT